MRTENGSTDSTRPAQARAGSFAARSAALGAVDLALRVALGDGLALVVRLACRARIPSEQLGAPAW